MVTDTYPCPSYTNAIMVVCLVKIPVASKLELFEIQRVKATLGKYWHSIIDGQLKSHEFIIVLPSSIVFRIFQWIKNIGKRTKSAKSRNKITATIDIKGAITLAIAVTSFLLVLTCRQEVIIAVIHQNINQYRFQSSLQEV